MEEIILAAPEDAEQVGRLYDRVLDHFEKHINYCYPIFNETRRCQHV